MIAEGERVESTQANNANILVIGIVSHKKEAVLTTPTSKRDQNRVNVLKQAFKSVFTMTRECDDTIYDRAHHLKHAMSRKGALALIEHLDRQNATVQFDFICLEFVRMPGTYYTDFITGKGRNPGAPLLGFICCLRDRGKLSSGCKVHRACALAASCSERYNHVAELENRNKNEKPFAEFTVFPDNVLPLPFTLTNPFSEDDDEESDRDPLLSILDTMIRNLSNERDHEYSDFDVDAVYRKLANSDFDVVAVNRDLLCEDSDEDSDFELEDGDEASDFDSKTSTEGTPVAPSSANDRDANEGIDIIDLDSEDDSDDVITIPKMTGAASAPQSTELSDDVITTPKMTGAVSAPQSTELIQKVAQRITNGESYRSACEALGFNLNENKAYKGSNTSDYSRLQCK